MNKIKKLFEVQTKLTSYTYSIVKIIICIAIIIFTFVRNLIFRFSIPWANIVLTVLCVQLMIFSILWLYISIGELFHTFANRRHINKNYQFVNVKQLKTEAITKIVSENDIVEIEVYDGNKIIPIGASSDCKYSNYIFKDKLFYISDSEYETVEIFAEALIALFPTGSVPVYKIDGLPLA